MDYDLCAQLFLLQSKCQSLPKQLNHLYLKRLSQQQEIHLKHYRHPILLIPAENEKDLVEIPENIKQNLDIRPVHWIDEVLAVALQHMPVPVDKADEEQGKAEAEPVKILQQGLTAH